MKDILTYHVFDLRATWEDGREVHAYLELWGLLLAGAAVIAWRRGWFRKSR